jgi:hypothetical protein
LAAQPELKPKEPGGPRHPTGGPNLTREHFVALSQISRQDFDEVAGVIADRMVQLCTQQYTNAENWCVAANGKTLGWYHDQETALGVAKHWLLLKSLRPYADVKVGQKKGALMNTTPKHIEAKEAAYRQVEALAPPRAWELVQDAIHQVEDKRNPKTLMQLKQAVLKLLQVMARDARDPKKPEAKKAYGILDSLFDRVFPLEGADTKVKMEDLRQAIAKIYGLYSGAPLMEYYAPQQEAYAALQSVPTRIKVKGQVYQLVTADAGTKAKLKDNLKTIGNYLANEVSRAAEQMPEDDDLNFLSLECGRALEDVIMAFDTCLKLSTSAEPVLPVAEAVSSLQNDLDKASDRIYSRINQLKGHKPQVS